MKTLKRTLVVLVLLFPLNVGHLKAAQPHMRAALEHLRAARAELQRAEHDKGRWRARALANVERAIADTENGMRAAR